MTNKSIKDHQRMKHALEDIAFHDFVERLGDVEALRKWIRYFIDVARAGLGKEDKSLREIEKIFEGETK